MSSSPIGSRARPDQAHAATVAEVKDGFDRSIMPELGPTPHYQPPRFERRRLSNGLELRIVERHELPIVTVDLIVKSGETLDPQREGGIGLAGREPARRGDDLAHLRSQLAGELSEIGATLGAGGGLESSSISLSVR